MKEVVPFLSEDNRYYYIYKITSLIPERPYYYFGLHTTKNLDDNYFGSGVHLLRILSKYGKENFKKEVLSYHSTKESLLKEEARLVGESNLKDPWCCNLASGGRSNIGYKYTEEQKARIVTGKQIGRAHV